LTLGDISMLRLSRSVERTTIPLIGRDAPVELLSPGKIGTVIGWGNTIPYGDLTSEILLQVDLPVIDDDQVMQVMLDYERNHLEEGEEEPEYTPEILKKLKHGMFGAGYLYENKDSGQGDSGGPFMIQDEQGNWVLAGLVSWGFEDAAQGAYGMYTRVSSYAYWVTNMVDGSRVFNYLEDTYPEIVGPSGPESEILGMEGIPVHYRCYEQKQACLAVTYGQLFYIGPLSNNQFVGIENLDDWLPLIEDSE
ncbi:MAG: trypsin-like serine protease, partial [Desulfonatronovibrio sp.]